MSKKFNLQTGKLGEQIAKKYLKKKGYRLVEENYKTKYGEIDLICSDGKKLVVVEVRTKRGDNFGSPEETLNKNKLRKVWLNGQSYIQRKRWSGEWRIDGVCITLDYYDNLVRINHYQNII